MLGFIGFGKMGEAFSAAISKKLIDNIIVFDKDPDRLFVAKNKYSFIAAKSCVEVVERSDLIFIAVKPQNVLELFDELKGVDFSGKIPVSIVAGVKSTRYFELSSMRRIVRVMPNVCALVEESVSAVSFVGEFSALEKERVFEVLRASGSVVEVDEKMMDAVTAFSGSGPAFVALIIEAFTDAGVRVGLARDKAFALSLYTFKGTISMIEKLGISPREIINMVTSPGGTTIAGLHVLERSGVRGIIMDTIFEAYKRSMELGNG